MPSFVPDTTCIVAALLEEHPHHERALAALDDLLDRGYSMLLVGHALFEAYSSLTRMPPPLRIEPAAAMQAIMAAFIDLGTVIALGPDEYVGVLHGFVDNEVLGGQVYDAEILLTFNERHFRRFEGDGLTVVVP